MIKDFILEQSFKYKELRQRKIGIKLLRKINRIAYHLATSDS